MSVGIKGLNGLVGQASPGQLRVPGPVAGGETPTVRLLGTCIGGVLGNCKFSSQSRLTVLLGIQIAGRSLELNIIACFCVGY